MRVLYTLLITICIFSACAVSAHETGRSHEETKDGFKIDIGYDDVLVAGEPLRLDFRLTPADDADADVDVYTDVWVSVMQGKKLFFAGDIHRPLFGPTGFSYVLGNPGTYVVTARFQDGDRVLTQTAFSVEVAPSGGDASVWGYTYALLAFLGGVAGAWVFQWYRIGRTHRGNPPQEGA